MKVSMIGLGKLGLPCAIEMSRKVKVCGYDINNISAPFAVADQLADCIKHSRFIFVAVPTPHDPAYGGQAPIDHLLPKDFDYSLVKDVLKQIAILRQPEQQVVLISTVLPGTTRRELAIIIPDLIYNPYLIALGTVAQDFLDPEMIIIGSDNTDVSELCDFYRLVLGGTPRFETGSWEDAESIKIFYNLFGSIKLAFVNTIMDVADRIGHVRVDRVTDAISNSNKRIMSNSYMTAGLGDGGACHPRDNIALRWLSHRLSLGYDLFGDIARTREAQARNLAEKLCGYELPVVIMGKSYKKNLSNTEGSYSLLVGHYVEKLAGAVHYIDPLNHADYEINKPATFLISFHHDWIQQYTKYPNGSIIVDPWRTGLRIPGCTVIDLGNN